MKESDKVVELVSAGKRFPQGAGFVDALQDVSLTVNRGDFIAIMGASGSGKSTLLHLIAGLTPPSSGKVVVNGHDLQTMSDYQLTLFRRQHVGLVFQAFNLIPSLTARDNILLPARARKKAKSCEALLDELLTKLDLQPRRNHRPDALSGGEQQRVAIARSLINDPAIVLADEPTGSLDSVSGQKLCKLLRHICDSEGRTIILVTHEPAVAIWSKQVMVLKDGCLVDSFETNFEDAHSLAAHYQSIVESNELVEATA